MYEAKTHPVPESVISHTHCTNDKYLEMYQHSINDTDKFWAEQAEIFLSWTKKWDKVQDCDFNEARIRWFEGGTLNVAFN